MSKQPFNPLSLNVYGPHKLLMNRIMREQLAYAKSLVPADATQNTTNSNSSSSSTSKTKQSRRSFFKSLLAQLQSQYNPTGSNSLNPNSLNLTSLLQRR